MIARPQRWYGEFVAGQIRQIERLIPNPALARSIIEVRSCLVADALISTGDPAMARWRPPVELDPETPFDPDEDQPAWLARLDALLERCAAGGPGGGVCRSDP